MTKEETVEYVSKELAKKIRGCMRECPPPMMFGDEKQRLNYIKNLSSLIDELLSNSEVKNRFENLIKNMDNYKAKIDTFGMIRNVVIHFPFFESWNEIYINENLLTWNRSYSSVKQYFVNYENKEMEYRVYKKYYGEWKETHTVKFIVPSIENDVFLNEIISEEDVIWTFCLIDSLLEDLGLDIEDDRHFSI